MVESTILFTTLFAMLGVLFISLIPFVPGPGLLWLITLLFGVLDQFQHLTLITFIFISMLMLAGSTTDFWMPMLGMKTRGASFSSVLGTIGGGLAGTFIVPIPLLGTFAGAMTGALLLELLRNGNLRQSFKSAGFALESYLLSMLVEFLIGVAMIALFVVSILITT